MSSENQPPELWRLPRVMSASGLSRAGVYAKELSGAFPKRIKIGRSSAWVSNEILDWIQARIAESRGVPSDR
jgi:prophage regulatory protein